MPRPTRVDVGGYVFHVLNRANARVQLFDTNDDYRCATGAWIKRIARQFGLE